VSRCAAAVAICLLLPLSVAAADPRGDAVACRGTSGPGDPPDLVHAAGSIAEEGSSAVWRLTFSEPLRVPDPVDPSFRVDVVIRDPKVRSVAYGDYRDFNRIVRYDATSRDARTELLYIAEGGHTVFDPPVIDGDTITIAMPGRLLLGADEFGVSAMQRLRWSVVVRDGGRCDLLGDGEPSLRLAAAPSPSPSSGAVASDRSVGGDGSGILIAAVVVLAAILVIVVVLRRRR